MCKRVALVVMTLALVAVLVGGAAAQQSLSWTAGAVGGGWYTISGGMAELLREKAGLNVKVIPGGGTQNPLLVEKGDAELGMGLPPLLGAALRGEDPYPGQKMEHLRALANVVQDSSAAVRQIATAVNQQNTGVNQVFAAVVDQNKMMEESVKQLDGTLKAVESLKSVSNGLAEVLARYKA